MPSISGLSFSSLKSRRSVIWLKDVHIIKMEEYTWLIRKKVINAWGGRRQSLQVVHFHPVCSLVQPRRQHTSDTRCESQNTSWRPIQVNASEWQDLKNLQIYCQIVFSTKHLLFHNIRMGKNQIMFTNRWWRIVMVQGTNSCKTFQQNVLKNDWMQPFKSLYIKYLFY